MNWKSFLFIFSATFILACQSKQTLTDTVAPDIQWGQLKSAYLNLPVSISLAKVERRVNDAIPWQFRNAAWPNFDVRGCGEPQIKYTVSRDSIHLKPEGNTLYFEMNLSYGIEGNYCPLCYDGQCKSPMLPFSCGVQKEQGRRINWVGKIIWSVGADFQLKTRSETLKLKALDPCEFTFLKMDFTKMVQQEFEKAIASALQSGDQMMSKINLLKSYQPILQLMNSGIELKQSEFLVVQPQMVSMSPVELKNKRMVTSVGLEAQVSWSNGPAKGSKPTPKFQYVKEQKSIPWELEVSLTWEAIQRLVVAQWEGKSMALNGGGSSIYFKEIKVHSKDQGYIQLDGVVDILTEKAKRKNVRFNLTARPVLNNSGQNLILEDVEFDLGFKNKILELGIGWELMQKRWKEESYNQIGLHKMLSTVVLEVNNKVSAIKSDQLGIIGAFNQALVKRLNLGEEGIEMTLALSGQWELLINP